MLRSARRARLEARKTSMQHSHLLVELVEQRLCFFEIGGGETFGEPAVDRREKVAGLGVTALVAAQPGEARGGAELRRTAAQERYPLRYIANFDLGPAVIDRSRRTPEGETLFRRHRNQPVCQLIRGCVVSDER